MSEVADRQVEALYREHGHRVLAYLVRRTSCPEDAADVMGEVMLTTWRRREDLPANPGDLLWLFAVARHTLANHRRATGRRDQVVERLAAVVSEAAADHSAAAGARIDVQRALDRLPPTDREILTLDAWEGLTSAEIGVILDMPAATVRSRLRRARRRLRATLGANTGPVPDPGASAVHSVR